MVNISDRIYFLPPLRFLEGVVSQKTVHKDPVLKTFLGPFHLNGDMIELVYVRSQATHARSGLLSHHTFPTYTTSPWTPGYCFPGFLLTKEALLAPIPTYFLLESGWSVAALISPGALREFQCFLILRRSFDWRFLSFFVPDGSGKTTLIFPEATSWTIFLQERVLWRISTRNWSLSSNVCKLYCLMIMLFNSSLEPCTLRFACRARRACKVFGCMTAGKTWISIWVAWIDLVNREAPNRPRYSETIILRSMMLCLQILLLNHVLNIV